MKGVIAAVLAVFIMTGTIKINGTIHLSDIARQSCDNKDNGSIVFFNSVSVHHPFGKTTCTDIHGIYVGDKNNMIITG